VCCGLQLFPCLSCPCYCLAVLLSCQVDGDMPGDSGEVAVTFNDGGDFSSGSELSKSDMAAISCVASIGGYGEGEGDTTGIPDEVSVYLCLCL
jgi:hypothetical protein